MNNSQNQESAKKVKAPESIVFDIKLEMKVFQKAVDEVALDSDSTAEEINEVMLAVGNKLAEWHDKLEKVQQLIEGYDPPEYVKNAVWAVAK